MSKTFVPTAQQAAIRTALLTSASNLAIVARAGTGKTTTALHVIVPTFLEMKPFAEILICCFGNGIAKEINEKAAKLGYEWKKVQASTTHSMGWGLVRFAFRLGNEHINAYKVRDLIDAQIAAFEAAGDEINANSWREFQGSIRRLVDMAKIDGFGYFPDCQIKTVEHWQRIADHYSIDDMEDARDAAFIIDAAQKIYQRSLDMVEQVDFADMVLWPLVKGLKVRFQKHLIIVDEAQDTSRTRQELISKFLRPDGRMIVIGDDRQAIMGFAGADVRALENMIERFQCEILPLNVTWRCPRSVVEIARSIVEDYEAADAAPAGEVLNIKDLPADLRPGDAVLCRNVAPLVDTAYSLIRQGKAAKVEGRDIGEGLISLAKRWKVATIDKLLHRLDVYEAREIEKAKAKKDDQKVESITDKCDTLRAVCGVCIQRRQTSVSDVIAFIEDLFADRTSGGVITLATYHRSKGREWPRVVLWDHHRRSPSKWAVKPWEVRQEQNLAYVAMTRAQATLVFATPPRDGDEAKFFQEA